MTKRTKSDHFSQLREDHVYHIYNRTNGGELLFIDDLDRQLFLNCISKYLSEYLKTYCYCLLGNHFHFLVKINSIDEIQKTILNIPPPIQTIAQKNFLQMREDEKTVHTVLERQFTRAFSSYATIFNERHKRKGNLFNKRFKRIEVDSEVYFARLVYYIHANPEKHKIFLDFRNYKWSSYRAFLSESKSILDRKTVLDWFGGKDAFLEFHCAAQEYKGMEHLLLED
jgi:putative transposase